MEEIRREFITAAQKEVNFSKLCREYGITRKTGYKWLERFKNNEGLGNKSKRPLNIPNKTSTETEDIILELRKENPGWGANNA